MAYCHRNSDSRNCGAGTVVTGQDFVKVEGQLWAVNGDPNDHGSGGLIASCDYISIAGKRIIVVGNSANPDNLCPVPGGNHCNPMSVGFSSLVNVN